MRPWVRGERKRHVVSILYRTTVGYALHNGVPVPAASSFDAAPRPISCLCMSGRGPHPPARDAMRGYHTASPRVTHRSSCPGSSRVSSCALLPFFFASRRTTEKPRLGRNTFIETDNVTPASRRVAPRHAVKAIFRRSLLLLLLLLLPST